MQALVLYGITAVYIHIFKQDKPLLEPKSLSSLNGFASIWCCIKNIFLAATAEGLACSLRIPMGSEPEYIAETLNHPGDYVMPCYLAPGYPKENACISEQKEYNIDSKIHMNQW